MQLLLVYKHPLSLAFNWSSDTRVILHCLPTGKLSSDERLIRSMLSCPLLLQFLSDLRKSVRPVYSLTVRADHSGSPFKQQQVLPCQISHQQHEQLQQGKWQKSPTSYSPEAHKEKHRCSSHQAIWFRVTWEGEIFLKCLHGTTKVLYRQL